MLLRKVFRFRMEPNSEQREALARNAGARRYVWNWALAQQQAYYRATGKSFPAKELSARLTALKRKAEYAWLLEIHAQIIQQTLTDLQRAYRNFFEKLARCPRFKSRKRDAARFRIPQRVKVENARVYVPKVGLIAIRQSQPVEGTPKSATFKRDATGNWDFTLVTEFVMPDTPLALADPAKVVGAHIGFDNFLALSDGSGPVPMPQFFRKAQRKLRKAQRVFSRRMKSSQRRLRAKRAVALVHRTTANQRKDFLHKLTTDLIKKYDGICIEDMNVAALAKTKLRGRAKSWNDAAAGEFRTQLVYKAIWNRRHLVVVNRRYLSSKTCHVCRVVNQALTLADRTWMCCCGVGHDRDFNAASNLRNQGLKLLAAGHADRITLVEPM